MRFSIFFRDKSARIGSALFFACFGAGALALGMGLFWRALRGDNAAFLQQSIGDTSSLLALQAQLEIERMARELRDVAKEKVSQTLERIQEEGSEVRISTSGNSKTIAAALAQAAAEIAAENRSGSIETEPDISEISIWKKGSSPQTSTRTYLAINSSFHSSVSENIAQRLEKIKNLEELDRKRIELAFAGKMVVISEPLPGHTKPICLLAVPMVVPGHSDEVVAAHVSLEKIQMLFAADGLVTSELLDHDGTILAHHDSKRIGQKDREAGKSLAPIFERLFEKSAMPSGTLTLKDSSGSSFFGGYRRIVGTGMAVISVADSDQGEVSLHRVRRQMFGYGIMVFFATFILGLVHLDRVWPTWAMKRAMDKAGTAPLKEHPGALSPEHESEPSLVDLLADADHYQRRHLESSQSLVPLQPRKFAVMALYGSLRGLNQLLDTAGPEETTEALNDYWLSMATNVRASGGHFECGPAGSFSAVWELKEKEPTLALSRAVLCALSLRREMVRLNESRKLDGKVVLQHGVGLHVGQALCARLGALPDLRVSFTGEAVACAQALDRLALKEGKDFVTTQQVVEMAHGVFKGACLGEVRLTRDTGLTSYYSIISYLDDQSLAAGKVEPDSMGILSPVQARVVADLDAIPKRWLVNNGSQIVGPFTIGELSKMLYLQELDFDCECWDEATGRSSILEKAGIFSGSQESDAIFWVYDGELVHGPMSEGFICTAAQRDAFGQSAAVCERSTIAGWKKLTSFVTDRKPDKDSAAAAA